MPILPRLSSLRRRFTHPSAPRLTTGEAAAPALSQRLGLRLQNSRFANSPAPNHTLANLIQLDAEPVWLRLLFVNDQPAPWSVDAAAFAPTAAIGNGVTPIGHDGRPDPGLWRPVTFEAGGADSDPPLDPLGATRQLEVPGNPRDDSRPVHAWSDWCPVSALPRRDDGRGVLFVVRTFSRGTMRFAASMGGPDPAIGRLHAGFAAAGDATDGASTARFQRDDKLFATADARRSRSSRPSPEWHSGANGNIPLQPAQALTLRLQPLPNAEHQIDVRVARPRKQPLKRRRASAR